ncbi:MAG TPA: valine--tRNA ligase, partial [Candidatus Acidoferrales bacterium]|nr:valine--tRNA ligase [Candidatus Acidoferrales bacterium]
AMPPAFDPATIEAGWYERWEKAGLFVADRDSSREKFTICLPPPNVTGELHMGHATNGSVQDAWARYRRMTGHEVLFLPGTDHAAIATQNVIERQLAQEGTTKEELGRDAFSARVQAWYDSVGATIVSQYRELGASLDWTRLRFTMDPAYVRAVLTAFVRFYEKGWLYRGPRIVNWCPRCLSAISDLEVEWREHKDTLYFIRYPIEGSDESLTIATVRPETMLADTGVAVHPNDGRYRKLVGRQAVLPLVGRRLPVVADDAVQKEFGTGALKVTPGHDQLDYEIGERHRLEIISAMHPDGRMKVPELPAYDGRPAVEARELVVRDLEAEGFLEKTEPYAHMVGHCDRCGTVIEPLISEQWWLRMGEMARAAEAASRSGKVRWHPERYERTYLDWLHGLRDWCVSRQLWLGHRIPVYTCAKGHVTAAVDPPSACPGCGETQLIQDPDVLDTWFSSALWPYATLGWPEATEDLRAFYPTSLNCTARGIINLWVSRMIMTGLEFTGGVPFTDVAIHCTILSRDGRVMSKSRPETVVDPRQMIRRYGADALRAWCALVAMSSQDVRFDESRIEGFRRFSNKLWNATRLVLSGLGTETPPPPAPDASLELEDRWILAELQSVIEKVSAGIEGFFFEGSISSAYDFAWHEFCDWYLEAAKARLRDGDPAARAVALYVLDVLLRLLHPFMPFVTEELWHHLPGDRDFLVRARWPSADERLLDPVSVAAFRAVKHEVSEIRATRKALGLPAIGGKYLPPPRMDAASTALVITLGELPITGEVAGDGVALASGGRVWLPSAARSPVGIQRDAETKRASHRLELLEAKLGDANFRTKASPEAVAKARAQADELRAKIARLFSQ